MLLPDTAAGPNDPAMARRRTAAANMVAFCDDLAAHGYPAQNVTELAEPPAAGGYLFQLVINQRRHEVRMPGVPLDEVRWNPDSGRRLRDCAHVTVDRNPAPWGRAVIALEPQEVTVL